MIIHVPKKPMIQFCHIASYFPFQRVSCSNIIIPFKAILIPQHLVSYLKSIVKKVYKIEGLEKGGK